MMPAKNIVMAIAFIICIMRRLMFVGLLGSFFLKKYIITKLIKAPLNSAAFMNTIKK